MYAATVTQTARPGFPGHEDSGALERIHQGEDLPERMNQA